jgi:glycosyltransferase involved in cell wall biosynthesis
MKQHSVAVILPCRNEEAAVGATVTAFRAALPDAVIYVFDNNSTDSTVNAARAAGAIIRTELTPGKGNVVRRMFADVDADVYVMADGDATYDASAAPTMIRKLIECQLDMVVGVRSSIANAAYRSGHRLGNAILTGMLSRIFGRSFSDVLSGYRVFSRRFVKSFPALSEGFEVETEISIHALELHMPVAEVVTAYKVRPEGSTSKLSTFRDGWRILLTILTLFRIEEPMLFFRYHWRVARIRFDRDRGASCRHICYDRLSAAFAHRGPFDRTHDTRLPELLQRNDSRHRRAWSPRVAAACLFGPAPPGIRDVTQSVSSGVP